MSYRLHQNDPRCIAHWPLQSDLSETSGNNLTAAMEAGTQGYTALDAGLNGFNFARSGSIDILAPNTPLLRIAGPITIEFLGIEHGSSQQYYVDCESFSSPSVNHNLYLWGYGTANTYVYQDNTGAQQQMNNPLIGDNAVHHFAVRRSLIGAGPSQLIEMFRDGVLQSHTVTTGTPTSDGSERLRIGGHSATWGGVAATFRVFGYSRSNQDIFDDAMWTLGIVSAQWDSPPAASIIEPSAALVCEGNAAAGIGNIIVTVTDLSGIPVTAFTTSDGWEPGFSGTTDGTSSIPSGVKVTVTKNIGWAFGPLSATATVSDNNGNTVSGSSSWQVGYTQPVDGAPDLVSQALTRVIQQYRASDKLLSLIGILISPIQELVNVAFVMPQLDDPTIATGVNLDVDGEIVGQPRQLPDGTIADDGEYLVLQTAKASRNAANGTGENLLSILSTLLNAPIVLNDYGGMAISYTILRAPTADEASVLGDLLARPMGVKVVRAWALVGYFGFFGDPNALGFSDHLGTVGGVFASEF